MGVCETKFFFANGEITMLGTRLPVMVKSPGTSLDVRSTGLMPSGLGTDIGGTWSKNPPPSSCAKKITLSLQEGPCITELIIFDAYCAPTCTLIGGSPCCGFPASKLLVCSESPSFRPVSMYEPAGNWPAAASVKN